MSEKIIVRIDPDIEDLVPGYLEGRHRDIAAITTAMAQGDFETVRVLGHGMKGSGGGYGFDGITIIGRELELAAKNSDAVTIKKMIDELADYLSRLELVYE